MSSRRFVVLGCGSIGKRHVRNLLALGEKNVVGFDPREDRRVEAKALGIETASTMDEVWAAKPDAVLVTSPSKLHVATALDAAERGVHMFVEKPVSDVHDAALDQLVSRVAEKKLVSL